MSGFTANGAIYVQGGSDGSVPADRDAVGAARRERASSPAGSTSPRPTSGRASRARPASCPGSHAFLIAGRTPEGVTADIARTNLAPQPPFFQLGLLGATVPALKLDGEIGQQIGYLNAATVGAINFILLILVAYALNHKEKVRALAERFRRRRS